MTDSATALGECPTGALKIQEIDAEPYDPKAARARLAKEKGPEAVRKFDLAGAAHAAGRHPGHHHGAIHGCPGTKIRDRRSSSASTSGPVPTSGMIGGHVLPSELSQWPVQIHLIQPDAPFFSNRDLAVISTCAPVASADIHWRFIRGRAVAIGCPKFDDTAPYAEKLAAILSDCSIPKVIVVRMEVPCCGGLSSIVREAIKLSGRTDLTAEEVIISLDGDLKETRPL